MFVYKTKFGDFKRKLWSSGRALGSRSEGRGFDPHPMLDGSGVKAIPGSISGSLQKIRQIQVAKWGTPKNLKKVLLYRLGVRSNL